MQACLERLEALLLALLREHAGGLSEYELLRRLQGLRPDWFPPRLFESGLGLFHAHFLLFHALYRLRDRLLGEGAGWLEIDVLWIRLHPPRDRPGRAGLLPADPLRDYYRDLDNLDGLDEAGVRDLLGAFWARYVAMEQRAAALRALGLEDPIGKRAIKRRYRRLAMTHHPDRGGDAEQFRRIQAAMDLLARC